MYYFKSNHHNYSNIYRTVRQNGQYLHWKMFGLPTEIWLYLGFIQIKSMIMNVHVWVIPNMNWMSFTIHHWSFLMTASTAAMTEGAVTWWACPNWRLSFNDIQHSQYCLFHSNIRTHGILYSPYTADIRGINFTSWHSFCSQKMLYNMLFLFLGLPSDVRCTDDSQTSLWACLSDKWHSGEHLHNSFLILNRQCFYTQTFCITDFCTKLVIQSVSFSFECPL